VSTSFDVAWDAAVQSLKRDGFAIEKANKGVGEITTEFQIAQPKKPKQSGMRYVVDLRKVSAAEPGVQVSGFEQTRYNVLAPDSWDAPKYKAEESESIMKGHTRRNGKRTKAGAGCEL